MNKLESRWSVSEGSDCIVLSSGLTAAEKQVRNTAMLVALLIHIALVYVVFPKAPPPAVPKVKPKPPVRIVMPLKEMEKLPDVILEPRVERIPVPDPTPDLEERMVPVDVNGEVPLGTPPWIPESAVTPPEPEGVFNPNTEGLVKPVYDMGQLQRNVHYPELGVASRLSGFVVVEMILRADGTVDGAQVIGGDLEPYSWFCNEAVRAVRRLSFEPGQFNDRPVDVRMHVTIHFRFR